MGDNGKSFLLYNGIYLSLTACQLHALWPKYVALYNWSSLYMLYNPVSSTGVLLKLNGSRLYTKPGGSEFSSYIIVLC